jgi:hypothetical protein
MWYWHTNRVGKYQKTDSTTENVTVLSEIVQFSSRKVGLIFINLQIRELFIFNKKKCLKISLKL